MANKKNLVTGGAGFIGSNFIHFLFKKYETINIKILNYDKLTYAGNLANLKGVENHPGYSFIKGDICDKQKLHLNYIKRKVFNNRAI